MADNWRAEMLLNQVTARSGGVHVIKLARALSLAVFIEPGLLRRARIQLVPGAGAGTESDLWFSPLVLTHNFTGIVLDPDVVTVLRQQLATGVDGPGFADRARDLIASLHAGHPLAVQLEEEVVWEAVRHRGAARMHIEARLRTAVKAMATDLDGGWDVARWAAQAWWRLPEAVTQTDAAHLLAIGAALRLGTAASVASFGEQTMPASIGWLAPSGVGASILLGVELAADGLRFAEPGTDSLVLELPPTSPLVLEVDWHDGVAPHSEMMTIAPGTDIVLGSIAGPVTLRTLAGQRYVVEPETADGSSVVTAEGPAVASAPPAPAPPGDDGLSRAARASCVIYADERHAGTGMLVTDNHVLTVAHVLNLGSRFAVRFPDGSGDTMIPAERLSLGADSEELDVAVLALEPSGQRPPPARLWPAKRLPKQTSTFGYPYGEEADLRGVWSDSEVAGIATDGRIQLAWAGTGTRPGQSGGPVCDRPSGLVVGIVVERSEAGRFDRMIPLTAVRRVWDALPRPWLFAGPSTRSYFFQRAMGGRSISRGGDAFTGRLRALNVVREFAGAKASPGVPLLITGQPGSGKSAVLARAVLELENAAQCDGVAFHARGAVAAELADAVAAACGIDTPASWPELVPTLAAQDRHDVLAVAVDALDEAVGGQGIADIGELLRELARLSWLRVAVTTRRHVIPDLYRPDSDVLIDLDSDEYFAAEDLIAYADILLAQTGFTNPGPPGGAWEWYRQNPAARARLAQVIASRADRSFLVAGLAASALAQDATGVDPASPAFDPGAVPSGLGEALAKELDRLPEPARRSELCLLTALAYGGDAGLDDRLWLTFAYALGCEEVTTEDLARLKAGRTADYLVEAAPEPDGPLLTRLFHPALADELLAVRDRKADEAALGQLLRAEGIRRDFP